MGPTGRSRILQIHPTRLCNLRCLHCYSSSGPEVRGALAPGLLRAVLREARDEGYTVAGFSGGEPLLYKPLAEVLDQAVSLGMFTTVTSNGMLLDERRLATLQGRTGLLAISLDGRPESHDRMRNDPRAFATLASRLDGVRASGIPFGFIFTLTQYNLDELAWVAQFAIDEGASLLQVHPLEVAGRAAEGLAAEHPDAQEGAWAYVASRAIQERVGGRLKVQLDLVDREGVRRTPERLFAAGLDSADRPLAELLTPLVLEADGTLVPVRYGFPRCWALGDVHADGLGALAARWKRDTAADFYALCRELLDELSGEAGLPMVNWYERLAARAGREDAALVALPAARPPVGAAISPVS